MNAVVSAMAMERAMMVAVEWIDPELPIGDLYMGSAGLSWSAGLVVTYTNMNDSDARHELAMIAPIQSISDMRRC
jgi:hypothetical protein